MHDVCLSVGWPVVSIYLSIHPSTHPSIHPSIHLSIYASMHLCMEASRHLASMHLCIYECMHVCMIACMCACVYASMNVSLSVCLPVCLSVCLCAWHPMFSHSSGYSYHVRAPISWRKTSAALVEAQTRRCTRVWSACLRSCSQHGSTWINMGGWKGSPENVGSNHQ